MTGALKNDVAFMEKKLLREKVFSKKNEMPYST